MTEELTKLEIKERIIELNYYMLTAIEISDKTSMEEIRDEIAELIDIYLKNNY
jgi:hypothetical protein